MTYIKAFKRRAGYRAVDKQLKVVSNTMLFKTVIPIRN